MPDIAKSRDANMGRKQNSFFFKPQVAIFQLRSSYRLQTYDHFSVEVFLQIANLRPAGQRSALVTGIVGLISIFQQGFIAKRI